MTKNDTNGYAIQLDETLAWVAHLNFEQQPALVALSDTVTSEAPYYYPLRCKEILAGSTLQDTWEKHGALTLDEDYQSYYTAQELSKRRPAEASPVRTLIDGIKSCALVDNIHDNPKLVLVDSPDVSTQLRQQLLDACRMDPTISLLATVERSAAACNYHFNNVAEDRSVAVIDLRAKNIATDVIQWKDCKAAIVARYSVDFAADNSLVTNILRRNRLEPGDASERLFLSRLILSQARNFTSQLETERSESLLVDGKFNQLKMNRDELQLAVNTVVERATSHVSNLLKEHEAIDDLVLIGNQYICSTLSASLFQQTGIRIHCDRSDTSPALGATALARSLGTPDVRPFGFVTAGPDGRSEHTWLFGNGRPLHGKSTRYFATSREKQERILIELAVPVSTSQTNRQTYLEVSLKQPVRAGSYIKLDFEYDGRNLTSISAIDENDRSLQCSFC